MIRIIAAIGINNALGKDNRLLWHLQDDLKRFKKLTSHQPIVMGRKTFESLPGILPNRKHIVISRNTNYLANNKEIEVVDSIEKALESAKKFSNDVFIIGGGNLYEQTLSIADILELTLVNDAPEADTFFPEIDTNDFQLVNREFHPKDSKHPHDFEYLTYQRTKRKVQQPLPEDSELS